MIKLRAIRDGITAPRIVAALIVLVCVLMVCLAGCSGTRKIASASVSAGQSAREIIHHAENIITQTEVIARTMPTVEDQVPWWVPILGLCVVAVIVGLLVWTLGPLVRKLAGFVPKPKQEAEMLGKLDDGKVSPQEFVAYKRADPRLNREWNKRKGKR